LIDMSVHDVVAGKSIHDTVALNNYETEMIILTVEAWPASSGSHHGN
jgi:hypothetical protein